MVITSSLNVHPTHRPGVNCAFASPLSDQTKLELTCSLLEAWRLSVLPGKRKEKRKGETMLSVDDVGKNQDCCELEKTKIGEKSDGSDYVTENEAEGSIEAVKSTSKTMAAADAKEKEELGLLTFPTVKMDVVAFQWVMWRMFFFYFLQFLQTTR